MSINERLEITPGRRDAVGVVKNFVKKRGGKETEKKVEEKEEEIKSVKVLGNLVTSSGVETEKRRWCIKKGERGTSCVCWRALNTRRQ